ncbi:MAG: c-type cytochrome [Anaerolineales bacterium]
MSGQYDVLQWEVRTNEPTSCPSHCGICRITNPVNANDESLARGEEIYTTHCANCHGNYGNSDGPGGASLGIASAAIAHTSQMMSDAYLLWHIPEGGIAFDTGMIPSR